MRGIESFPPEQRAALRRLMAWMHKTGRRMMEKEDIEGMTRDERQHIRNTVEARIALGKQFDEENNVPPDAPAY
jgi:hypothetical protein